MPSTKVGKLIPTSGEGLAEPVAQAAGVAGRHDADRDADREPDHDAAEHERHRRRDAVDDDLGHRQLAAIGEAEVALQQVRR